MKKVNKIFFYILSFTWGIVVSLIGSIFAIIFLIKGIKPLRFGYDIVFHIQMNDRWGLSLGPFIFISSDNVDIKVLMHEHGHSIQNCFYGPLMPFIVMIPSIIRFWYIEIFYYRKKKKYGKAYDSIWFEKQATNLGTNFYHNLLNNQKGKEIW